MKIQTLALTFALGLFAQRPYTIETVAGDAGPGDGGPAFAARLRSVEGIAVDGAGRMYLADAGDHRVRAIAADGAISTLAGTGAPGYAGDGGPATGAQLNAPYGLALDAGGNLYVADLNNGRVRRISPEGEISTVAGGGGLAFYEGVAATEAHLAAPRNVAAGPAGDLYISDFGAHKVYRLTAGRLYTAAANGLSYPAGLAFDGLGAMYVADSGNNRIAKIAAGGVSTVATGPLSAPTGVAIDAAGALYAADSVRTLRVAPAGEASRIGGAARGLAVDMAGNLYAGGGGRVTKITPGGDTFSVAGGSSVGIRRPSGIAMHRSGTVYVADGERNGIYRIDRSGAVSALAAGGLSSPAGLAIDAEGALYVAEAGGGRVVRIPAAGSPAVFAGGGTGAEDGGPARMAKLGRPEGLAFDISGNLYIADSAVHRVWKVTPGGVIYSFAGTGQPGYEGDGGAARAARFNAPRGLAFEGGGLYVADSGNHRIRRISVTGSVSTVAGDGTPGFDERRLNTPVGLAAGEDGAVYVADGGNHAVRRVGSEGLVTTLAGTGAPGYSGDGGPADAAALDTPAALAIGAEGSIYIADGGNGRVRKLTPGRAEANTVAVVNAASGLAGPVAPGEIVTVTGLGAGDDFEFRFDDVAARALERRLGEAKLLVPYETAGLEKVVLEVLRGGSTVVRATLAVAETAPGIFTATGGSGQALAVNQDGSINSAANPAEKGSIVSIFGTGEGLLSPGGTPLSVFSLTIGGEGAEALYAGRSSFPGLLQVNARIPAGAAAGSVAVEIKIGGFSSQPGVTVAVR